jgi:hypothetical protein
MAQQSLRPHAFNAPRLGFVDTRLGRRAMTDMNSGGYVKSATADLDRCYAFAGRIRKHMTGVFP